MTQEISQFEKFNTDIDYAEGYAKDGQMNFANDWFYRALDRAETHLTGIELEKARRAYKRVYQKYFAQ